MSVPSSEITICSVPALDNRYEHTLWFENADKQQEYFMAHYVKHYNNYTFLRRNNTIKVEANMGEAKNWHYLYLYNSYPEAKYYYYFINKVNYVNECTVELEIELDVIQTYMFNWSLGQCFIERTHTDSDQLGEHTIEEGLETGPLIVGDKKNYYFNDLCILVMTAVDSDVNSAYANIYDQVFSGLRIYAVNPSDYKTFGTYLDNLSATGKIDAIVSMWMYPKELVTIQGDWDSDTLLKTVVGRVTAVETTVYDPFTAPNKFEGYEPTNRKLYTYPYCMYYVTNNMGGSAVYRVERFNEHATTYKFKLYGALSPESGVKLVPCQYNNEVESVDDGLTLGSFPTCAWDSDPYKVWLAQNQNSHDLAQKQAIIQAGAGALTSLGSIATGNIMGAMGGVGMAYNALTTTQQLMAQKKDMDIQPSQARGVQSANLNLANGMHGFTFVTKTVTAEHAKAIDDYFSRYGYKVNRVATPSLRNREKFTYIKTVGCTVAGNVPAQDRVAIGNIFDKGITFWADPNVVGYYGENPTI